MARTARSRLAASGLAAVLLAGIFSAPAQAAPDDDTDVDLPPLGTPHSVQTDASRPTSATGLADDGVARAYQQWRKGAVTPQAGVRKGALRVQVEHAPGGGAAATARELGATNVTDVTPTVFVADVPFDGLRALQDAAPVRTVTLPPTINVVPDDGLAKSAAAASAGNGKEIVTKTNAAAWQAAGITGAGVKIGVIDEFDDAARFSAVSAGEVNANSIAGTFCRDNGTTCDLWASGVEHGVAVVEILNDMAPGATLYLATAATLADTKAAVDFFASNGVKIITRSLTTPYDGPGDGTGPADDIGDYAVSKGMTWFNSAGNAGMRDPGWGGYWRGKWNDPDGNGWLNFTAQNGYQSEFMQTECGFFNGLRWDDWGEQNRTDYDLYASVFDDSGEVVIATSLSDQRAAGSPADPLEGTGAAIIGQGSFSDIDCYEYPLYFLSIAEHHPGASDDDTLEILVNNSILVNFATGPGAASQPFVDSANPGLVAVGAVDPVSGDVIAGYSSQGPTNDLRIKPDLSAGSGFSSFTYGSFSGTSASSPAAAGAAALVLQTERGLSPARLADYLKNSATTDRGTAGPDNAYGAGEVRLNTDHPFTVTASPSIGGTAKVGSRLTASTGSWSPAPAHLFYQWCANGSPIAGAVSNTLTLTASHVGKRISVRVTATGLAQGRTPTMRSSGQTAPVAAAAPPPPPVPIPLTAATPRIQGNLAVGQKVTAVPGAWTSGTAFTYQWYANGKAISGARSSTLKLAKAQAGKTLSVKVTGKKSGYTTVTKASATTKKLLNAAVPKISGTKKVGSKLKVTRGTWTSKVKFSYRWYRNGAAISKATATKYKLTKRDKGKKITVKITGKRSGYATVTLTSSRTSTIR